MSAASGNISDFLTVFSLFRFLFIYFVIFLSFFTSLFGLFLSLIFSFTSAHSGGFISHSNARCSQLQTSGVSCGLWSSFWHSSMTAALSLTSSRTACSATQTPRTGWLGEGWANGEEEPHCRVSSSLRMEGKADRFGVPAPASRLRQTHHSGSPEERRKKQPGHFVACKASGCIVHRPPISAAKNPAEMQSSQKKPETK